MTDGLRYRTFWYHSSKVHLLEIDLSKRSIKLVPAAQAFPFQKQCPVLDARKLGALASVGCGYNVTWFHDLGFVDQPLHTLVIDKEIWSTGVGAGGYGLQLSNGFASIKRNSVQAHVWGQGESAEVEAVNFGHTERVAAFSPRGGTNQVPDPTKHLYPIDDKTIESRWPLGFAPQRWTQDLGGVGVTDIVSGWPQIVLDGVNIVPDLEMDPEASHGPDAWFVQPNPRLALGVSQDGHTVFFCTVEGRVPHSEGLRLRQLAQLLVRRGVHDAVNMDGGGSAYMWFKEGGLVADSCYGDGTLEGLRPDHVATAVF